MSGKRTKYLVLVGAFMINIANCTSMTYGNLSTYMFSFFYFRSVPGADDFSPAAMHGVILVSGCVVALFVDAMRRQLGLRATTAVSIALCTLSFLLTYVTIRCSTWATTFTFMFLAGLGDGIAVPVTLLYVAGWFRDGSLGVAMALVGASSGLGGFIFNNLVSVYTNPDNLSPDIVYGEMSYFSQEQILDRVPETFLIVGCITGAVQIIGFCFLREPPSLKGSEPEREPESCRHGEEKEEENANDPKTKKNENVENAVERNDNIRTFPSLKVNDVISRDEFYASSDEQGNNNSKTINYLSEPKVGVNGIDKDTIKCKDLNEQTLLLDKTKNNKKTDTATAPATKTITTTTETSADRDKDTTPKQLLTTEVFYLIWFSAFAEALGLLIVSTFYKTFGQLWIADDRLLGTTAGVSSMLSSISRPLGGHLIDRLGVKSALIGHTALSSLLLSLWYFTPIIGRYLFFLWTNVLFAVYYNQFVVYPVVCFKLFGAAHFATNLFLVQTAMTLVMIAMPPVLTSILESTGWFWLYSFGSATALFSVVSLVFRMVPG